MNKDGLLAKLNYCGFSTNILKAFADVNRADFIPEKQKKFAYEDTALPIGYGQTISQPYTIAFMLQLLTLADAQRVLEIGSGSGYVLALLSAIVPNADIHGVEIISELVNLSRQSLRNQKNITIHLACKDIGLSAEQPFDRILVSAAAQKFPDSLISQLDDNGIIVCPVQNSIIKLIKKNGVVISKKSYPGFAFVPLIEVNQG